MQCKRGRILTSLKILCGSERTSTLSFMIAGATRLTRVIICYLHPTGSRIASRTSFISSTSNTLRHSGSGSVCWKSFFDLCRRELVELTVHAVGRLCGLGQTRCGLRDHSRSCRHHLGTMFFHISGKDCKESSAGLDSRHRRLGNLSNSHGYVLRPTDSDPRQDDAPVQPSPRNTLITAVSAR